MFNLEEQLASQQHWYITRIADVNEKFSQRIEELKEFHSKEVEFIITRLEVAQERADYFEKLLLTKSGILIAESDGSVDDGQKFESINRMSSLSSMRRQAERLLRERTSVNNSPETLTEGELRFEADLAKVRGDA